MDHFMCCYFPESSLTNIMMEIVISFIDVLYVYVILLKTLAKTSSHFNIVSISRTVSSYSIKPNLSYY